MKTRPESATASGKGNSKTHNLLPSVTPLHLQALRLRVKPPRFAIEFVVLGADLALELLVFGTLLALKVIQSIDELVDLFALEGTVAVSFDVMLVTNLSNEVFAFDQAMVMCL